MPEFPLDPELAAVGQALGGLTPKPAAVDRDRLLYEAGRRSVRSPSRAWPMVAGLFAVLSAGLGFRLTTVSPHVELVYVSRPEVGREAPPSAEETVALGGASWLTEQPTIVSADYLRLRNQVVRFGADVLQTGAAGRPAPEPPVEYLLGLPAGTLSDSQKSRWQHQLFRGDV